MKSQIFISKRTLKLPMYSGLVMAASLTRRTGFLTIERVVNFARDVLGRVRSASNPIPGWPKAIVFSLCLLGASLTRASAYTGVVAWGLYWNGGTNYSPLFVPSSVSNVVSIAAGANHYLALMADGTVIALGNDLYGQCNVPARLGGVAAIAGGGGHSLALKNDGTVVAWGDNSWGECNVPWELSGVVAISAGAGFSLALKANGTVVAWGDNEYGQCSVPAGLGGAVAISAGDNFSLALTANGTVVGWGDLVYGWNTVPAGLSGIVKIDAGSYFNLALQGNGTVVAWGECDYGQCSAPVANAVAIAAGSQNSVALTADGRVAAWGWNAEGQCNVPAGLVNAVAIAAGGDQGIALVPLLVPTIWLQSPATTSVPQGGSANLSVAGSSASPLSCQWSLNGVPITGATATNLSVSSFDLSQAAAYSVTVSNQLGQDSATMVLRLANSPVVLVDGVDVGGGTVDRFGPVQITMSSSYATNADIYYTLDGSAPDYTRKHYGGSFALTRTATIRAIAYNQAYTASAEAAPITVQFFGDKTLGGGSVSLTPAPNSGINGYVTNTLVAATATASNGWSFLQWLGEVGGTSPAVTAAMTPDKAVQAVFGTPISTNVLGSGSIVLSPQVPLYPFGTVARLAAVPQPGSYFLAWRGSVTGTNNPTTLIVNQPTQLLTATFASLPASRYSLAVVSDGNGSVTANPYALFYTNMQTVWLSAVPDVEQAFLGWSGDASGTNNLLAVTMDQSKIITADFTKSSILSTPADLAGFTPTGFRVFVTGEFGAAYQILGATNLTDWLLVGEVTNYFGTFQFTDSAATNLPNRFYRALSLGP
jgi:hypothetical protein